MRTVCSDSWGRIFATLFILAIAAFLASCNVWGPPNNPVDPSASDYQGYPTVTSSEGISSISPVNGGTLYGMLTMSAVLGATNYEIVLASSPAGLNSSPLYDNSSYTTNIASIYAAPLVAGATYYWKARAEVAGGWGAMWSPVSSFTTNVMWPWTDQATAGSEYWHSIASSSDGTHLAAVVYYGDIWTSTNSGASWTDQSAAGSRYWQSIASSSDGTHLAAVVSGGDIWTGVVAP
jgi:hypothetical protein